MTEFIKQNALEIGFDACGIAKADFLEADARFLSAWLEDGYQGEMSYLERNFDKRTDPRKIVEGCKSVVVTLLNYYPANFQSQHTYQVSKYAFSKVDYHTVVKEMLQELETKITARFGADCFNTAFQHRFVDSAPVLERRWAERAGLGWIGKNKMLINPTLGSFCFIGILMLNKQLTYDEPMKNRCGTCTKCLDACPTSALTMDRGLNAKRCISYQTIEKKGEIEPKIRSNLSGYIYGCDICNDVCPWNKTRAKPHSHEALQQVDEVVDWMPEDWENLSEEIFNRTFKHSAIRRAGFCKLKQNIAFLKTN